MHIRRPNTVTKAIYGQINSLFGPGDIAPIKLPAATNLLERTDLDCLADTQSTVTEVLEAVPSNDSQQCFQTRQTSWNVNMKLEGDCFAHDLTHWQLMAHFPFTHYASPPTWALMWLPKFWRSP